MTQPVSTVTARPAPEDGPTPICQYCLADPRHTPLATHLPADQRCPLCGVAYTGPRRSAQFRALTDAGLVAIEE